MMNAHLIDIARQMIAGTWPRTQNNVDMLETAIEQHGLQNKYVEALFDVLGNQSINNPIESRDMWEFLRATPEQKARAFLMVVA
jgi:hypothetical protein